MSAVPTDADEDVASPVATARARLARDPRFQSVLAASLSASAVPVSGNRAAPRPSPLAPGDVPLWGADTVAGGARRGSSKAGHDDDVTAGAMDVGTGSIDRASDAQGSSSICGSLARGAPCLAFPAAVAVHAREVLVADSSGNRLVVIDATSGRLTRELGLPSAFAPDDEEETGLLAPMGVTTTDEHGGLALVSCWGDHSICVLALSGASARRVAGAGRAGCADGVGANAKFAFPCGLVTVPAFARAHPALLEVFVADQQNHRVRRVELDVARGTLANVSTLVGRDAAGGLDDGSCDVAGLFLPSALALSADESTLFVGQAGAVRAINLYEGLVRTLAGSLDPAARPFDGTGDLARFGEVGGLVVLGDGSVLAADTRNRQLRRLRVAVSDASPCESSLWVAADAARAVHVTTVCGTGRRGVTDGAAAEFVSPMGLALTVTGEHVLCADFGAHRVRSVRVGWPRWSPLVHLHQHRPARERVRALLVLARAGDSAAVATPRNTPLAMLRRCSVPVLHALFAAIAGSSPHVAEADADRTAAAGAAAGPASGPVFRLAL